MQPPAPQHEHRWLERLVGDWTFEIDADAPPDAPPDAPTGKHTGVEHVRSVGGLWVVAEGHGTMPDGGAAASIMTLGFDPAIGRFVGTFVSTMMTHLWRYDGALDADGRSLVLDTEGPSFAAEGRTEPYRDVIAFESDDHRTLTSYLRGEDGAWRAFMTAHYRRTGAAGADDPGR